MLLDLYRRSDTTQKMEFSIKDFFSKYDQIRSFLRIWLHLLKKFLMENSIFCAVRTANRPYKEAFFLFHFRGVLNGNIGQKWVENFSSKGRLPTGNYMFKVNNRNTRARCEICSKLTIKTGKCRLGSVERYLLKAGNKGIETTYVKNAFSLGLVRYFPLNESLPWEAYQ